MTAIIRAATVEDAPALAHIHQVSFAEAWDADSFRRLLERDGAFALAGKNAAETDLQSFILIQVAADESEILSIATCPQARRSGLARALVIAAMAEAARRGAKTMFLEVADDNVAALALYQNLGFAAHGRRRAYYIRSNAPPIDALTLRAHLSKESWE
ncbi:MAG TPA: GNAT family N-acetyltransferase [Micropepsaceae bacterium]|nr:GNAT family N-acetyltransferase [Micropepsaceae bacterium]